MVYICLHIYIFRLLLPTCLGGLEGVSRGDASIGDMRGTPSVAGQPSRSLGFGLSMGTSCPSYDDDPTWPMLTSWVSCDPYGSLGSIGVDVCAAHHLCCSSRESKNGS